MKATTKIQVIEPRWGELYTDELDVEIARQTWRETVQSMTTDGTLRSVNGHAIKRLAHFRVIYEQMVRLVAEEGVTWTTKSGSSQYNPNYIVMRQAEDTIGRLEAALGIDPIKRTKAMKSGEIEEESKQAQGYLSTVAA